MNSAHILVIDDDTRLLKALAEVIQLQLPHVVVEVCSSPWKGLEKVAITEYDVIVSDIKMPGMDGLGLLAELRSRRPNTPILLMTSHDDRDIIIRALRGGVYDFIQKPLDQDYFIASLQRAIQMNQLNRQVASQKIALEQHAQELEQAVQKAVAETKVAQKRLTFLADATTLLASSLDYAATLMRVARLAVLYLADYCIVDVYNDEVLESLAIAHVDRKQEILVRKMRERYQADNNALYPALSVLKSGNSLLHTTISAGQLEAQAIDPEQLEIWYKLNPGSAIYVPLKAGDRLLGVLTFVRVKPNPCYGLDDLVLAEDLTRRAAMAVDNARLYNETQEALQVRDQFLSIAAHELRTPLTAISGTAQLLLRGAERDNDSDPRLLSRLQVLIKQTHRLNRLVSTLLDLSRLEAGQFALEKNLIDVTALAQRVVEEMAVAVDTHKLEFRSSVKALLISGDDLRLEQVLQNLIQNAIKYSPKGGNVLVKVEDVNNQAAISVSDQGIGIPVKSQAHLFNRFYRADNVNEQKIGGLGLGLYVVKEIVTLHDGLIEVSSIEGQGSTFTINLPLYQSANP